jgi:hypothetical protein
MPYSWPADTDFRLWELDVLDRDCSACGRRMHVCDHRYRHFHTLKNPVELVCKLTHCPDQNCPGNSKTKSPELEFTIAPPKMAIGWDVLCWIGPVLSGIPPKISRWSRAISDCRSVPTSPASSSVAHRRPQRMRRRGHGRARRPALTSPRLSFSHASSPRSAAPLRTAAPAPGGSA